MSRHENGICRLFLCVDVSRYVVYNSVADTFGAFTMLTMANEPRKRGRPRTKPPGTPPNRQGVACNFYISTDLAAALDAFAKDQIVTPEKSAIFRKALENFLETQGFWPP